MKILIRDLNLALFQNVNPKKFAIHNDEFDLGFSERKKVRPWKFKVSPMPERKIK
jgi:hypothetical protein